MFGSIPGAIIAFVGHLISALLGGMPWDHSTCWLVLKWQCLFGCLLIVYKKGITITS